MAVNDLDLDQIIAAIDTAQAAGKPLDRVTAAREVAARLEAFAHHVVAHYVDEARQAGASWTDIGAALSVTRQAAQQRFVPAEGGGVGAASRSPAAVPYSPRATAALEAARDLAREQHQTVTDLHLLLALLDNRSGGAIVLLRGLDRRAADVRKLARATLAAEGTRASAKSPDLGRAAARALEVATREALRLGADDVGTEHLLLALASDEQRPAGRVLAEAGLSYPALRREAANQARLARERTAQKRTRKKRP
ncbi:Clp protease N-terminal domain-containing protein [Actinopolymorpha sp. B17G11]|uniref:Clp protease N-terminal domain-containing protein n=1 Tax=unclassified Actinopolymorpha TaxID=2627063 RepID=UPI0032D95CB6